MKYKVKVGTLGFEQGIFQKGDIIEVTEERAALFDKLDVEAVPEPIKTPEPIVAVKPVTKKKTVTAVPVVEAEPTKEEPPVIEEVKPIEEA